MNSFAQLLYYYNFNEIPTKILKKDIILEAISKLINKPYEYVEKLQKIINEIIITDIMTDLELIYSYLTFYKKITNIHKLEYMIGRYVFERIHLLDPKLEEYLTDIIKVRLNNNNITKEYDPINLIKNEITKNILEVYIYYIIRFLHGKETDRNFYINSHYPLSDEELNAVKNMIKDYEKTYKVLYENKKTKNNKKDNTKIKKTNKVNNKINNKKTNKTNKKTNKRKIKV